MVPPNTDISTGDFSVDRSSRCDSGGQDVSVVFVYFVVVVKVEKEKGRVQQNSRAMLVVNDLYNKCIPFQAREG